MTTTQPASRDRPAAWAPGSTVLGEFLVERPLGAGGYGRVELVHSRHSGQRYAVRRLLLIDPLAQGTFLKEVQRWMGLPAHDHIVACYFLRTVGEEVAVFTEYVSGGSLADWLRSGKLWEDAADPPLRRVVDIAVQSAWGIDAAHAMGLLHLDVKPANLLLSEDRTTKITDFGMATPADRSVEEIVELEAVLDYVANGPHVDAATRETIRNALAEQIVAARPEQTIKARSAGGTQAYASPEQAERRTAGRGADIWSWGLTVLEMFAGELSWPSGTLAAPVLERIAARRGQGPADLPLFALDLLRRCFRDDPGQRPRSLRDAADELLDGLEQTTGRPLGRRAPARPSVLDAPRRHDRILLTGARWNDPRAWLDYAYRSAGLDVEQAIEFWPISDAPGSMAVADLRALSEARKVLEPVAATGSPELRTALARLLAEIAVVHRSVGDGAAAIEKYRRAAEIAATVDGDTARADLAIILSGLSVALRESGSADAAVQEASRAADVAGWLGDRAEAHVLRGNALLAKANALPAGQQRTELYGSVVAEYEASGDADAIAKGLAAQAGDLEGAGRPEEAALVWRRAEVMLDDLIGAGRIDLRQVRARTALNKALLAEPGPEQARLADAAASLLSDLVGNSGMRDLVGDLAAATFLRASGHELAGRPLDAARDYRAARLAFEQAVFADGRGDLTLDLARAYGHESALAALLGDQAEPVRLAERAAELWERLAPADAADARLPELAQARTKLASALRLSGDLPRARGEAEQAVALLDRPGVPGAPASPSLRIHLARAQAELAAIERLEGNPAAAAQRLRQALDGLGGEPGDAAADVRAHVWLRLGNTLLDLRAYDDAVAAYDASIQAAESSQAIRTSAAAAVEARHARVNALLHLGDYNQAVGAAEDALARFETLIAGGRTDLRRDQARLRAALGQALYWRNGDNSDLSEAVAAWRQAGPVLAEIDGAQGALAAQQLSQQADELSALLEVTPAEMGRRIGDLKDRFASATRLSQAGQVEGASILLEDCLATGQALRRLAGSDALTELCGEIGAAVGVTAMHSGRYAAALRGFGVAADLYLALYTTGRRQEHLDRWCGAQTGAASIALLNGDQPTASHALDVVGTFLQRTDPAGAAARLGRMRSALEAIGLALR